MLPDLSNWYLSIFDTQTTPLSAIRYRRRYQPRFNE